MFEKSACFMNSQSCGCAPSLLVIDEAKTSFRTSCGCRMATWSAMLAPLLNPKRSALSTFRYRRRAATSSADDSNVTGASRSVVRPCPCSSTAMTLRLPAKTGSTLLNVTSMVDPPP